MEGTQRSDLWQDCRPLDTMGMARALSMLELSAAIAIHCLTAQNDTLRPGADE